VVSRRFNSNGLEEDIQSHKRYDASKGWVDCDGWYWSGSSWEMFTFRLPSWNQVGMVAYKKSLGKGNYWVEVENKTNIDGLEIKIDWIDQEYGWTVNAMNWRAWNSRDASPYGIDTGVNFNNNPNVIIKVYYRAKGKMSWGDFFFGNVG
jgi:hypothetical protein